MKNRLFVVEGLPCSGKSSVAAFAAEVLGRTQKVIVVDEGTGDHPADYEFHALAPAEGPGETARVVSLAEYQGEARERLMPFKIYDGLPWEAEKPLMLDKWRTFLRERDPEAVYVFNCVLLQNPMCETMMRFDFPEEVSAAYIGEIARMLRPLEPVVIYLKNDDIAASVARASRERPGWLEAVIEYHAAGAYGKRVGVRGLEGYLACLAERQERELRILSGLPVEAWVLENPQRDWDAAMEELRGRLEDLAGK